MSELMMTNAREKFASARETCPGMSEEIYALTDYIAAVADDRLAPDGVMIMLLCIMDDLDKKRCGFSAAGIDFPKYLTEHNLQVKAQVPYVLQVVDAISGADFAEAVRQECNAAFHWTIPKRVTLSDEVDESENIKAAVNWWAEAIQHPKMDNGTDEMSIFMAMFGGSRKRQFSEDELLTFRKELAAGIKAQMEGVNEVMLSVDYGPDQVLGRAGDAIGLGGFDYPCKTMMWITKTDVTVRAGYGASKDVIWRADMA